MSVAIPYVCGAVLLVLSILEARLIARNRKLKARLRQALLDCRAFYEIEARMAGRIAEDQPNGRLSGSVIAVKRMYRAAIRVDGMLSPSDRATPHQIAQELAKL